RLDSLSYVPTASAGRPERVDGKRVHDDLARLAMVARSIRTYSATGGMAAVPPMAERFGMTVSVGAWIGRDAARNAAEINGALRAAANANVDALIIGNEALLRNDVSVAALRAMLRRTRANTTVPVTTAEPWHVWLKHPALANEVDFMAVHVLPYWEGVPADRAVAYLQEIYDRLTQAFPGRRIAIAEFGWPSDGHNRGHAIPGVLEQATVVRDIAAAAQHRGLGYNIVDAFDQPWKTAEGRVGPYWGLFDADRRQKFPLTGPVQDDHSAAAVLAILLGGLLSVMTLAGRRLRFAHAAAATLAANAAGAGAALILLLPADLYMTSGEIVFWGLGLAMLLPLAAACLARCDTLARDLFGYSPQRLVRWPARPGEGWRWPKVSIHVPACREPPALVIACLDSLARLDYPRFEVVVVVNNTPDEDLWRPVEAHCRALGDRFGFLHLPRVDGYKAGALNAALAASDPDAEIVAVVDADYRVEPRWLRDLAPLFQDPKVALVQAPQDHTEADAATAQRMMNCEYAGFFDIGMVQRNEANAIIAHGTMLLLRKHALARTGGWRSETIVEDTELGLRLLAAGHRAHYTNTRYGYGMLPNSVDAYRRQRQRWAHGAMQILRMYWRFLLPWRRDLTWRQKGHFLSGWLVWLSDAAAAALAVLNLLATPLILTGLIALPPASLVIPALVAFAVAGLHTAILYRRRVTRAPRRIAAAALCAMGLQLVVAGSVLTGLLGRKLPFRRTEKGRSATATTAHRRSARAEPWLGLVLAAAAASLWATNAHDVREQTLFALLLAVQSLPFLATAVLDVIERIDVGALPASRRWRPASAGRAAP
ncbi:MAG: glycosyltransferase, partial [Alphaproteobacteria bacterium]|nr:glycosyltransferase [Alphaproteobacteria bacterium]